VRTTISIFDEVIDGGGKRVYSIRAETRKAGRRGRGGVVGEEEGSGAKRQERLVEWSESGRRARRGRRGVCSSIAEIITSFARRATLGGRRYGKEFRSRLPGQATVEGGRRAGGREGMLERIM
jgi:hypothetical protein